MRCPFCDSKRVTDYKSLQYCRACKARFSIHIKVIPATSCFKCGREIIDPSKEVLMGNGKIKHQRCKARKEQ